METAGSILWFPEAGSGSRITAGGSGLQGSSGRRGTRTRQKKEERREMKEEEN